MIRYLLDSSALWRLLREKDIHKAWFQTVSLGAIASCTPQRIEFRRSARGIDEYEHMGEMFETLYPEAVLPDQIWQWIERSQFRLSRSGAQRALSTVDLLVCGVAAHHRLVILHDDRDFTTAGRILRDVRERSIYDIPGAGQPSV